MSVQNRPVEGLPFIVTRTADPLAGREHRRFIGVFFHTDSPNSEAEAAWLEYAALIEPALNTTTPSKREFLAGWHIAKGRA